MLRRMLRYDLWANGEALRSLGQASAPAKCIKWMAHILGAELLWLARIRREPATTPVWPDLDVSGCGAKLAELSGIWDGYLRDGGTLKLTEKISYTNSKGETWTSTVEDILIHLTIHSAYHRGQIASDMRSAGLEPAYTDYIHAMRQGLIE
ncbi:MAG TPA: DinB family protein [Gemmatimonadales bacterium]